MTGSRMVGTICQRDAAPQGPLWRRDHVHRRRPGRGGAVRVDVVRAGSVSDGLCWRLIMIRFASLVAVLLALPAIGRAADPKDWPSYNGGAAAGDSTRARPRSVRTPSAGSKRNARFPAKGSDLKIGVVHATPVVVAGEVYFGTVTKPTFFKLAPNGQLKWSYTLAARAAGGLELDRTGRVPKEADEAPGVYGSALVTDDGVYFADLAGFLYALDRKTGKEKWKVDTRSQGLPRRAPAQRHLRLAHSRRRQDRLRRRRVRAVVRAQHSHTRAALAAATLWPSTPRPARSRGSTTSVPSPSRSTRRSRSRMPGANTFSTSAPRRAPSGGRRRSMPRPGPSSSAPIPTTRRASRPRTTRASIRSMAAPLSRSMPPPGERNG